MLTPGAVELLVRAPCTIAGVLPAAVVVVRGGAGLDALSAPVIDVSPLWSIAGADGFAGGGGGLGGAMASDMSSKTRVNTWRKERGDAGSVVRVEKSC